MYQGISLRQAPPLGVVISFFLNAQCYLILAGISFFLELSPITLVHCLTLGFLLLSVFGAITQMLPVLAGIYLPRVRVVSALTLIFMNLGILLFIVGSGLVFKDSLLEFTFGLALGCISLGILIFLGNVFYQARHITHKTPTIYYMFAALVVLVGLWIAGLTLGIKFVGFTWGLESQIWLLLTHRIFALSFVTLLIFGVILQVLPMFYVAPAYPKIFYATIVPLLFALLLCGVIVGFLDENLQNPIIYFFYALLGVLLLSLGVMSLRILFLRKRKITEVSLWFWVFGFSNLIACALCCFSFLGGLDSTLPFLSKLVAFFALGFVLSIIFAMMFKIVPFLTWFHLSFNGILELPNMREIIPQKAMKWHFTIFIVSYLGLLFSCFFVFASGLILLGGLGIFYISKAFRLYLCMLKTST